MNKKIANIQALRDEISNEIKVKQQKEPNVFHQVTLKALEGISRRLEKIENLLQIQKYDLVFIGQVGAGKTTAICHLFNLVYKAEEIRKDSNRERRIKRVRELLSTGAGNTTIGEVVIKPAQESFFEIEPYKEENILELIEKFCYYTWLKVYPNPNEATQTPPSELLRAIRNIVDLKESTAVQTSIDKATEFAKEFSEEQYQDFRNAVVERANLSQRTETRILSNLSELGEREKEEKIWLQKTFSDLNLAKLPNYSIPKKINIYINSDILDFNEFTRIGSVIDTRGLDVGQTRQDLADYIRNNAGAICLFTEVFSPAPTNVAGLIGMYLTPESKDIDTKFVLFVMPRKGEPENVVGSDGTVENRDEGIALRRGDIDAAFTGQNIKFLSQNIFFYDALQYYLADGRCDPDYEAYDIEAEKKRIFTEINNVISNREALLLQEVDSLKQNFQEIKNGRGFNSDDEQLIIAARENIRGFRYLNFVADDFVTKYIDKWKLRSPMSLRATNKRFGVYEPRSIDIYFDAVSIVENLARKNMWEPKFRIVQAVESIEDRASDVLNLQPLMQNFKSQIDILYESLVRQLGQDVQEFLKNKIFYPQTLENKFWVNVQIRWGKGSGYKNDVLSMYAEQVEEVNDYLKNKAQQLWEESFIKTILAFFG